MKRRIGQLLALLLVAAVLAGCMPSTQEGTTGVPETFQQTQPNQTTPPATTDQTTAVTSPSETVAATLETTRPSRPAENVNVGTIAAQKAFLYDYDENRYLYIKGQLDETLYPASITKLMTAYVVRRHLKPDDLVTAGDALDLVAKDTSKMNLQKGDVLTVSDLLKGMLIVSGCDAAYVLAEAAGEAITGDPCMTMEQKLRAFVNQMNQQAEQLGLVNSHFANPDGYHDPELHSCMADITILAGLTMDDPLLREICGTATTQVTTQGGKVIQLVNSNHLLTPVPEKSYIHPDAVGMKTGTTQAAGHCLLASFQWNGRNILVGVFLCKDDPQRLESATAIYEAWKTAAMANP